MQRNCRFHRPSPCRYVSAATFIFGGRKMRSSSRKALCGAKVETLETRKLLSATMNNGVLVVNGTSGNDQITISLLATDSSQIETSVNGEQQLFQREAI